MAPTQPPLQFKIHGMDCAEEVTVLKRELGPVVGGVDFLAFDILNGRMSITPRAAEMSAQSIIDAVARTGMRAELLRDDEGLTDQGRFWENYGRTALMVATGVLALVGFLIHLWHAGGLQGALGSEGTGIVHEVPLAAKILYGLSILSGANVG